MNGRRQQSQLSSSNMNLYGCLTVSLIDKNVVRVFLVVNRNISVDAFLER